MSIIKLEFPRQGCAGFEGNGPIKLNARQEKRQLHNESGSTDEVE
jgi:hypothetical protein